MLKELVCLPVLILIEYIYPGISYFHNSIKALNPVYKAYVDRITSKVSGIPGVLSVNLDSERQYDFTFTFEKDEESDLSQITEQIKYLLRVYGSTILDVTQYQQEAILLTNR